MMQNSSLTHIGVIWRSNCVLMPGFLVRQSDFCGAVEGNQQKIQVAAIQRRHVQNFSQIAEKKQLLPDSFSFPCFRRAVDNSTQDFGFLRTQILICDRSQACDISKSVSSPARIAVRNAIKIWIPENCNLGSKIVIILPTF